MHKKTYSNLVKQLLERVPNNVKAVAYLMDVLELGSEAAYRRLRGEVPFSAEEIIRLSIELGVSIDSVINQNDESQNDEGAFFSSLNQLCNLLSKSGKNQVHIAINSFNPVLLVSFDTLFKFSYYRWQHRIRQISPTLTFSKLVMPAREKQLQGKICLAIHQLSKTSIILDNNVFLNLIKDIKCFYLKQLITEEEKEVLKNELVGLVDQYQQYSETGLLELNPITIYLSVHLSICTDSGLIYSGNKYQSLYRLNEAHDIVVNNPTNFDLLGSEFAFFKNQAVNITLSNEIKRLEFFNNQRQYISEL
jgi:hypothetical protein